ncbi:MAG: exodeoxyribonuclease VII small subunit [Bacilli bacterium]|nr:exodeoxyribonuclease VII small subunit [Bacilli bacterium]
MEEKQENKQSFEERLARLNEIVTKVETHTLPLEEALALFEEGIKIQKELTEELKSAQTKMEELTGETSDKE